MNLWFRVIWMFLSSALGPRTDVEDGARLSFRVWPHDCDLNLHLTNARFHSFNDLARIAMLVKSGAFGSVRKQKWAPILAGASIKFLKPLAPFEPFTVTSRILSWDDKWIYIEHRTERYDRQLAAYAVVRTCFVGKDGRVPVDDVKQAFGYTGERPEAPENFSGLFDQNAMTPAKAA